MHTGLIKLSIRISDFIACSVLLLFPFGCASSQGGEVRQKLRGYQVGTTTFEDFKRDAGLVKIKAPMNVPVFRPSSELSTNADFRSISNFVTAGAWFPTQMASDPFFGTSYGLAKDSPWKVLKQGVNASFVNARS